MKDKTLKILLSIIAINLTVQTVRDVGLFSTSYAQSDVQRVTICNELGDTCAGVQSIPSMTAMEAYLVQQGHSAFQKTLATG